MKQTISIKQILIDLLSIIEQVVSKYKSDEEYKTLIDFLKAEDYLNDDEIPFPTLKQIEKETGLKTHQLRNQLKKIYNSLFYFESDFSFKFDKVEIVFNAEYFKRYATLRFNDLTQLPRIGENIEMPFLKAKVGTSRFFVEDIIHSFESKKHIIDIHLKGGFFNLYWYYRKHKAYELGELGRGEQYKLYEFQLKERLGLRL